jgi:hypothetical protein
VRLADGLAVPRRAVPASAAAFVLFFTWRDLY